MDRFDAMLAFTRVVELSSFTKASKSLTLPKTTLSAQILALERRLGARLLNRTTRHVGVTDEGVAYYQRVVSLLSQLEETEALVRASKVEPRGRLRVDMPPAVAHRIVIPALGSFIERYPDITLEVGCTDRPLDLVPEGVDCVLRGNLIYDESLLFANSGLSTSGPAPRQPIWKGMAPRKPRKKWGVTWSAKSSRQKTAGFLNSISRKTASEPMSWASILRLTMI